MEQIINIIIDGPNLTPIGIYCVIHLTLWLIISMHRFFDWANSDLSSKTPTIEKFFEKNKKENFYCYGSFYLKIIFSIILDFLIWPIKFIFFIFRHLTKSTKEIEGEK